MGDHVFTPFQFFEAAIDFFFPFLQRQSGTLNVVTLLLNRSELPFQFLFPGRDLFVKACHIVEMAS